MNINKTSTTPYHPETNGKNENSHRFLMSIVRILCEKCPTRWADCSLVAAFAWNTSTIKELNYLTPHELTYGEMCNMPHQLTQFREELGTDVKESDYPSYATFLQDMVELYYASFREAKLFIQMKLHVKLHSKLKDASKVPWLKPGRLVLVFSPSDVTDDNFRTSAKLVFQFTGPLRIVKVHRNAVHLQYLDGTPHTTRSIKHVYPYNREHDELL